jgi:YesN/AraC family two-component response regulator
LEFVVPIFINGEYVSAVCGGEVRTDIRDCVDYVYPQEEFDEDLRVLYEGLRAVERERYFAATKLIEMMVNNLSSLDVMLKIAKTSADTRKVDERVKKAVEYIQQNYSKKISMAQLADLSCVSENYFSKLFVRVMKTSVSDYIASYRIEKSKEYLLQTDLKVSKISEMVGFEDPAYFHRVFKKYTGMTPHEFRDAARV